MDTPIAGELRCYAALDALGHTLQPGESALDAVLRILAAADPLLRPYCYEQVPGMRTAYQAWLSAGGRGELNTFQAGYTAAQKTLPPTGIPQEK